MFAHKGAPFICWMTNSHCYFYYVVLFLRPYTLKRVVIQNAGSKAKDLEAGEAEKVIEDPAAQQPEPTDGAERASVAKDDVRTAEGTLAEDREGQDVVEGDASRKSIEKSDQ